MTGARGAGAGLVVGALAAAGAAAHATSIAWVSDDAFISFRYAQHLARGEGLVFNAGERVEGYTNFLWTVACAVPEALGVDPVLPAMAAGVLSFAATVVLLAATSGRIARDLGVAPPLLPLAALAWAAHGHARVFATGGLETALFTLLATATVVCAAGASTRTAALAAGILGGLATLTRPEGALYLGLAALCAPPGHRAAAALAGAAIVTPYAAWKLVYYGDLLPNTWHAKAGGGPAWSRGLHYLGLYFGAYWPVALGFPAAAWAALRSPVAKQTPPGGGWASRRAAVLLLLATGLSTVYVARVGGDFMYARFCLPFTPLLLLAVERAAAPFGLWRGAAALGIATGVLFARIPAGLDGRGSGPPGLDGVVEERAWYPPEALAEARRQGGVLRAATQGVPVRVAIWGTQAMVAYYAEPAWVLEASAGLTDRELARWEPPDAARAGHRRDVDRRYLRERGVDLTLGFRGSGRADPLTHVDFGEGVTATLVTYRVPIVDALVARGARLTRVEPLVDAALAALPATSTAQVAATYEMLRGYYFAHNDDPLRERPFLARIGATPSEH